MKLTECYQRNSEEISEKLLITMKKNAPEMLKGREWERIGFEANLYSVWGRAFDLLEMLIVLSLEVESCTTANIERTLSTKMTLFLMPLSGCTQGLAMFALKFLYY